MRKIQLTAESKKDILDDLLKRSPNNYGEYESVVADIIEKVRTKGDEAVFSFTKQFDKWEIDQDKIRVAEEEIAEAFDQMDADFIGVMERAAANITAFHTKQLHNSWIDPRPDGSILGQKITPIAVSGVYVPAGVVMTIFFTPAAFAGSTFINTLLG